MAPVSGPLRPVPGSEPDARSPLAASGSSPQDLNAGLEHLPDRNPGDIKPPFIGQPVPEIHAIDQLIARLWSADDSMRSEWPVKVRAGWPEDGHGGRADRARKVTDAAIVSNVKVGFGT